MFYKKGIDITNDKQMFNFLKDHYQYYTMNSWNRQKSIAHNVKLYNLNLDGDWTVAMRYLFDESDAGLLQMYIEDEIRAFEEEYRWYKVGFNGRSGGYLVLYNADNNTSVLPDCLDYDTYEDFKTEAHWDGYRVTDFDRELREAVEIVREFDKLCDRLRDLVNEYSKRSFDVDKLEAALEWFNNEYGDDLVWLDITGPVLEADRIRLNDITSFATFMHCFRDCLGEDRKRIAIDSEGKYLWLKEA